MNWKAILESETVQRFGITLVGFAVAYIVWVELNNQLQGRFASQDSRIEHMEQENSFYREIITENQAQHRTLFTAIKEHLAELTKRRPTSTHD